MFSRDFTIKFPLSKLVTIVGEKGTSMVSIFKISLRKPPKDIEKYGVCKIRMCMYSITHYT